MEIYIIVMHIGYVFSFRSPNVIEFRSMANRRQQIEIELMRVKRTTEMD